MIANMRMYHSTTSHVQDAKWFTAIDMAAHNAQTNLHGHPNAERLIIDDCGAGRESWDWATRVPPTELKARFVISVRNAARAAREGDRLVVFIVGHGSQASRTKGHVFVGEHSAFNGATLLRPEDVLIPASRSRGNTTVVVDACYSGTWGSALDLLGAGRSSRGTIALLTRSSADNETLSFPRSNSRRYRGSYFAHFLAEGLYLEYDICFPHPDVIGDGGGRVNLFAPSNVSDQQLRRAPMVPIRRTGFVEFMQNITRRTLALGGGLPTPTYATTTAARAVMISDRALDVLGANHSFTLTISQTVAASPLDSSDCSTGRYGSGELGNYYLLTSRSLPGT